MNSYINKSEENKNQKTLNVTQKRNNDNVTSDFSDKYPTTVAQMQLQKTAKNSEQVKQGLQLQEMVNVNSSFSIQKKDIEEDEVQMKAIPIQKKDIGEEELQMKAIPVQKKDIEEEPLQGKFTLPIQKKENNTGLPDNLKSGIENLSGYAMDDVKVHYNSDKPAQLQAHAYAQGTDIHIASGQEKYLPHEAWHVVQQKQGRVQPTFQMKGNVNVNDDAGLENEADVMGTKALQTKLSKNNNIVSSLKKESGAVFFGVSQMVNKEIGKIDRRGQHPSGIIDSNHIILELYDDNLYNWPSDISDHFFNDQSYSGTVKRAMDWGAGGGEGTSGWFARTYTPDTFHNLAVAASTSVNLIKEEQALNNESNETLISIRTFRASNMDMAERTRQDLHAVLNGVNSQRTNLANEGMIANPLDVVNEVKADPAEAHPNTLPTAKITFSGGETLYFKGRSGSVEDALIGTNNSSAMAISNLGVANVGDEVGTHTFINDNYTHISANVGMPTARGPVTDEEAKRAWVSAARTAAIVSLSGTGDLHSSNVIDGTTGTKHIIDAEFLLDVTAWTQYETASQNNEIPNFEMVSMAPEWLKKYTHNLSMIQKIQLSDEVALRFQAMGLNNDNILEQVLAPIKALIANEVLLRISPEPFTTAFWLTNISSYHELKNAQEINTYMDEIWQFLSDIYPNQYHIDLKNKINVLKTIKQNFNDGMVPLFHLGASTGTFYLNKDTYLGNVRADRSTDNFLELTKTALINGYQNMVLKVREAIIIS